MRGKLIIAGAGVMQGPAIRIAKELGFYTVAVDGSAAAPCASWADRFEQIDLKDKEGIEALARSIAAETETSGIGIMTAGTDFSATAAWVAERLDLPGIPYESALNASDKARMRACFAKAGLPSPAFTVITAETEIGQFSPPAPFPLVIKPVDNMGGRGCRKVNNMAEFSAAAADALRYSRSGRAIVEAYMDGPEYSVDAIVYHGEITICGLADRHIFFPPYFIEMGHTMPTAAPIEQQNELLETFRAGVRALGLAGADSVGAAKGDIKMTSAGPMIGEIAARLSGGYMSGWTYPYASGVEPVRAAILAAMGRPPQNLMPCKNWTCAERAFISIPGKVQSVTGAETAQSLPHVRDFFLRAAAGDTVIFPENNVSKCGNIIAAAPDRQTAAQDAETAARSVLIRLDPANRETAAFLASAAATENNFPPDAFPLPAELAEKLSQLPPAAGGDFQGAAENIAVVAFPEFTASGICDYSGRGVEETLQAVRQLTGLSLPEITVKQAESSDNKYTVLGREFWAALVRGGYQGAVYYIDSILSCVNTA